LSVGLFSVKQELARMVIFDNKKHATAAFATFSPFKSRRSRLKEWIALFFAPGNDEVARKPAFLHTAQFCVVSPSHLRRVGLTSPRLKYGALLFMSAYNGDPESYFRGFNKDLFTVMDEVWMHCEQWHGAREFAKLNTFIQKFRRESQVFCNAYPGTVKHVRAGLVLGRQIDDLLAVARAGSSDEFKREFEKLVVSQWG
jgi:hypothetical protein